MSYSKYPDSLKRGDLIEVEGRHMRVHRIDAGHVFDRVGRKVVPLTGIEMTSGTYLTLPAEEPVLILNKRSIGETSYAR